MQCFGWTRRACVGHLLLSVGVVAGLVVSGGPVRAQEEVENPIFKNWSRFPVGSKVTYSSVTESEESETKQELIYTLKEKTKDRVVIGRQVVFLLPDGSRNEIPEMTSQNARTYRLAPGFKRPDPDNPPGLMEKGEERVELAGRKIKTEWFKAKMRVEAGDMFTRSWSSADVPGGLVKSISETPATKSVHRIELIAMQIPGEESPKTAASEDGESE